MLSLFPPIVIVLLLLPQLLPPSFIVAAEQIRSTALDFELKQQRGLDFDFFPDLIC